MTDLLAVMRDDQVLRVYALNGDGAAVELAQLRLADASVDNIASVVEGLRPFLMTQQTAPQKAQTTETKRAPSRQTFAPGVRAPERRAQMALAYVTAHPGASTREVLEHLGLTGTGSAQTQRLVKAGLRYELVKEGGRGRHGAYRWYVA
jgi:hypothetical protein